MKYFILVLTSLSLFSCASIPSSAKKGTQFADRGKYEAADQAYAKTMSEDLAEDEFDLVAELRCNARQKSVDARLAEIKDDGAPAEYIELMNYISRCEDFAKSHEKIYAALSKATDKKMKEVRLEIKSGKLTSALASANQLLAFLPAGHPFEKEVASLRSLVSAKYREEKNNHSLGIATLFDTLAKASDGKSDKLNLEGTRNVLKPLSDHHLSQTEFTVDASCKGLHAPALPTASSPGAGMKAIVNFSQCSTVVEVVDEKEAYEVLETKVKNVQITEAKQVPVISYRNAYDCLNGTSNCVRVTEKITNYRTTTVKKTVQRTVEEKVTKYRPVRRLVTTWKTSAQIRIQDEASNIVFNEKIVTTKKNKRIFQPGENVQSAISEMNRQEKARPFFNAISKSLSEQVKEKMKRVRAHTLVQQGGPDEIMAAWMLSPQELKPAAINQMKTLLGVELMAFPSNPFFQPEALQNEFAYAPFTYLPQSNLVAKGYPEIAIGMGLLYGQTPTGLVGQPDRSYGGMRLTSNYRKSLMTGKNAKGVGLMLGFDGTLGIASRFGDDYQRLREPSSTLFVDEKEETGVAALYEGQVFASLGFRLRQFALFGGVAPRYDGGVIGFYRTHGGSIPFFGRVELRFVERFPIVIEGRFGNLLDSPNQVQGGTIEIPISEGFWIQGGFVQTTLPAQFLGLDENDEIRIDAAQLSTGHIGMWFGF